jgi:hypothetical protein
LIENSNLSAQTPEQESYTISNQHAGDSTPVWRRFVVVLLVLLLMAVVVVLPRFFQQENPIIADEDLRPVANNELVNPVSELDSPLAEAEKLQFRRDTQDVLANIINLKSILNEKFVKRWANDPFAESELQLLAAEQSYQRGYYELSLTEFTAVEAKMLELESLYEPLLKAHLATAEQQFIDEASDAAIAAYREALLMAPNNDQAIKGLRRAENLPQVLERLSLARENFSQGEFAESIEQTELALALDSEYSPAILQKKLASDAFREQRFQDYMSQGYAMLDQRQWQKSQEAFSHARDENKERTEPIEALDQVASRRQQEKVRQELERAQQFESNEQWQEALGVYDQLLVRDPGLVDAAARRVKVRVRAAIDSELNRYLSSPLELSDGRLYNKAQQLLVNTRSLAQPDSRLHDQLEQLAKVLERMSQEYTVEFVSDGLTDVSLFRVSSLGRFISKAYRLKPGKYVVAGGRPGYRDVRIEFTLTGLDEFPKIRVQCTESI